MKAVTTLLLTAIWASGCGLGTEVGNGVHPSSGSGQGGTSSGGADKAQDQPGTATGNTTSTPGGIAPTPSDTNNGGAATSSPGAAGSVAKPTGWKPSTGFDFDLSILTETCASPLAAAITSPVTLAHKAADGTLSDELTFTLATDGTWTVADRTGTVLRHVTKGTASSSVGPYPVTATGGAGDQIDGTYSQCQPPQTKTLANGQQETSVVILTAPQNGAKADLSTTVTWDLSGQSLVKVTVTGYGVANDGSIELDAQ